MMTEREIRLMISQTKYRPKKLIMVKRWQAANPDKVKIYKARYYLKVKARCAST